MAEHVSPADANLLAQYRIGAFQAAKVRVTVDGPAGIEIVYLYCAPDVIYARRIELHLRQARVDRILNKAHDDAGKYWPRHLRFA